MKITRVNIKDKPTPHYTLYIGRKNHWLDLEQSKWANPFIMKNEGQRAEVIAQYEAYIRSRPDLLKDLKELEGQILGCYCKSYKNCHGDVLIKLYKEFYPKFEIGHTITQDQIFEACIREIYFRPDDGFPLCVGYIIGSDDGKSTAYQNADKAYLVYLKNKKDEKIIG